MKKLALTSFALIAALYTNAQDLYKAKPVEPAETHQTAKENFIEQQAYLLNATSTQDYHKGNDSLNGFDEAAAKADMFANNVYGEEAINYLRVLKRHFIYNKYKNVPIAM